MIYFQIKIEEQYSLLKAIPFLSVDFFIFINHFFLIILYAKTTGNALF